jgi:hypothetical protein
LDINNTTVKNTRGIVEFTTTQGDTVENRNKEGTATNDRQIIRSGESLIKKNLKEKEHQRERRGERAVKKFS